MHDSDNKRPPIGSHVNLRLLEMFVAAAEAGSMSLAAERLQLSQPAVSKAIRALEDMVGQQLFDRSVRPPVLTLHGTLTLKHATAVLDSIKQFDQSIRLG